MTDTRFSTPRGTVRERFRYLFITPWWRGVWLVGAVVWGVALNVIVITQPEHNQTLGALSIIPMVALGADVFARSARIEKRAKAMASSDPTETDSEDHS